MTKARSLKTEEVQALLKATSKDTLKAFSDRMYLLMIFNLGLRVHEAMKVKFKDIDLEEGTIEIIGKGSKRRLLGTNPVLIDELLQYMDMLGDKLGAEDYVIQTSEGSIQRKPASRMHGLRVLKKYAIKACIDLEGISTHSGRVTAINFLLDNDVSLRDAANFAGHADVSTTRGYDRKDDDKVIQTCNIIDFTKDE